MNARIKVEELPMFDAAPYLDSDEAIAAYLTDILQANALTTRPKRLSRKPCLVFHTSTLPLLSLCI